MSVCKTHFWLLLMLIPTVLAACNGQGAYPYPMASASQLPEFLHGADMTVRQAYRFAIANPHELEKYPCYCGCVYMGHKNNLDCYIKDIDAKGNITFDEHANGCGICVEITQDVMRLKAEGKSSIEIRAYIDAQYSQRGPGTDSYRGRVDLAGHPYRNNPTI